MMDEDEDEDDLISLMFVPDVTVSRVPSDDLW